MIIKNKIGALALLLSAVMAASPAMTVMAADDASAMSAVLESGEMVRETVAEEPAPAVETPSAEVPSALPVETPVESSPVETAGTEDKAVQADDQAEESEADGQISVEESDAAEDIKEDSADRDKGDREASVLDAALVNDELVKETPVTPAAQITTVSVVKNDGSVYGMFPVADPVCKKEGGVIKISFNTAAKKTYSRIYLGPETDADKTGYFTGDNASGVMTFDIEVPAEKAGSWIRVTVGKADSWKEDAVLWMSIPVVEEESGGEGSEEPEGNPADLWGNTSLADGVYTTTVSCVSSAMFKVVECEITVKDGKGQALITLSGTGYSKLFMDTKEKAGEAAEESLIPSCGTKTYTDASGAAKTGTQFKVPFSETGKEVTMSALGSKWFDRVIIFSSDDLKAKEDEKQDPANLWGETSLADGVYTTTVSCVSSAMFKVIECEITVKDGKGQALLTLSGTGYSKLFMDTKEKAGEAAEESLIPSCGTKTYTDANGDTKTGTQFKVPFGKTDEEVTMSALGSKWYDRVIVFSGADLKEKDDGTDSGDTDDPKEEKPGTQTEQKEDKIPEKESSSSVDTNKSTSAVNSSTTLADGVYKPDCFSFSGGTGKVRISCTKITVTGGQAYATLVFDSPNYVYVKANGRQYNTSVSGGSATVTIPVQLNANNTIIGMTTKMSAAHEVTYIIFPYLAAANGGSGSGDAALNKALHDEAPEIMGLKAVEGEDKLVEYAEYFNLFHYDKGITLLEIDLTKDTARDPELQKEQDKEQNKDASDNKNAEETIPAEPDTENADLASEESGEASEDDAATLTDAEAAAELYKDNIVSYLLVPEDTVLPAGLDKDMIIIELPVENTYAAADDMLSAMNKLELLENVAAVAMPEEEIKKTEGLKEDAVFGGTFESPDFKALLKAKVDLMLMPSALLPKMDDTAEAADETADSKAADDKEEDSKISSEASEEKLSVEEQTRRFYELAEKAAMMGLPLIVDRSADEKDDLAQKEWIKVYGALFGCEEEAHALFEKELES